MDGERFDRLTVAWAGGVGRRSALRGAVGAVIAGTRPASGRRRAAASAGVAACTASSCPGVSAAARPGARRGRPNSPATTTQTTSAARRWRARFLRLAVKNNGCSPKAGAECPTGFTCVVNLGASPAGRCARPRRNAPRRAMGASTDSVSRPPATRRAPHSGPSPGRRRGSGPRQTCCDRCARLSGRDLDGPRSLRVGRSGSPSTPRGEMAVPRFRWTGFRPSTAPFRGPPSLGGKRELSRTIKVLG